LADQPPSTPAATRFHEGKRLPRALGVISAGLVGGLLVTIYGTYRWGWTWTGYRDNATLWNWLELVLLPVTVALLPLWLRSRERRKTYWRVGFGMLALAFAVLAVGGYRWDWGWTGFKGNTLWNWLGLFLVPFALPAVVAWATTPPPPTPDDRVPPDQAVSRRPGTARPVAGVVVAPRAGDSAGTPSRASAPVDPVDADATDPGIRVATGAEQPDQTPLTGPHAARRGPLPTAGLARPPAGQRPTVAGPGAGGIAPAHSAAGRLVQAHPAMAIATSLAVIGLLSIAALLPGRAPQPPTATARTVIVPGTQGLSDTGVYLTKGERVTITASGQVDPDGPGRSPQVGPDGNPDQKLRTFSILPDFPHAALIGQIVGSIQGHRFLVGSHYHIDSIGQSGLLLLGVNDRGRRENRGEFAARIDVARP
jgi:hypothetical protein